MPTWGQVGTELQRLFLAQQASRTKPDPLAPSPYDVIRRKYLAEFAAHTGRPVIVYASAWLEGRPVADPSLVSVSTRDVMAFMEVVKGLPRGPLDLILHSPGGDGDAARQIMAYLRSEGFEDIRAIVPLAAMSAATMMALSCNEILMGNHSQLGPIDPQFTLLTPDGPRSSPAQAILDQFERAKVELAGSPAALNAWLPILRSYAPGMLSQCVTAQQLAEEMVATAMTDHMFKHLGAVDAKLQAERIAAWFNDHKTHGSHGRPLPLGQVKKQGVRVSALEDDRELQDKVLSAWHGVQHSLTGVAVSKIVENHLGRAWIIQSQTGMLMLGPQQGGPPANSPAPPASPPQTARAPSGNRQARRHPGR
jgi:hypothetical protein